VAVSAANPSTASCLYEGTISHWRARPRRHFVHRLALVYLDLDELPELLNGRLVAPGFGAARFRRRDYLGDSGTELDAAVRGAVQTQTGRRPDGPIRILTQLRSFGLCFNPVSFYYCFDGRGIEIESVVAEVTNTPWGERHAYVVPGGSGTLSKALHVSPFFPMGQTYTCHAGLPDASFSIAIESWERGSRVFGAELALCRRELTHDSLRSITVRYPLATLRILALIYGHAIGLRCAGATFYSHPERETSLV
jgi:DUF1365 family protein